ncbi:serine/threonine-protein phosphatase 6 regulatory ankyrin repeat subunit B-like [Solanum pennellii]|uniref:Serine/threonine-protein phosphatase 6 regulatory ankyrin repeat subunit B-like n=1 Tax=Solanum pennellii TaxID=28526 RepID=A0ABM1FYF3_SOLPN|nr:serine/threonine-protein phosphatase 6 regulatory ankyrin repeat subunit B-like [Solanum pennellii]
MPPTYFPLRWESTGDQWWYASPIDYAAANGHYDLVRELLRLDGNHLIKLTSLRRIRRLESVWDDEEQFDDVARCRSKVARKLMLECDTKKGKNSLLKAGYGGWLLYTAASAGDLPFVQELLERNPLLVFGEGEYGVTDILYAAARSKSCDLFKVLFDFAITPRFLVRDGGEMDKHIGGEIPSAYKWEMMNRAIHAAARGGNLQVLKELLAECCDDILAYRDIQGATPLHAAAAKGQVEVVQHLIKSFDIINSTDNQGNTALHIAASRGQLAVVEALIVASSSLVYLRNNAGETFLHVAITGFQTPCFRRLDHQIQLMKQLVCGKFNIEEIVNAENKDGRTALHLAVIGNIHSELVELLMTVRSVNVNTRDKDGMTPLDILRQRPRSASSDLLTKQLISAGGIFSQHDHSARRVVASHLKMQHVGSSPGTSFRLSDTEIFLYTGIEHDGNESAELSTSTELSQHNLNTENDCSRNEGKTNSANNAAQRLKRFFYWPKIRKGDTQRLKKLADQSCARNSEAAPVPLRQRFSKPSSLPNNKRTLSVRSNLPSPTAKKKLASGLVNGVMLAIPHLSVRRRSSCSSSFSISSVSSHTSLDQQKATQIENELARPSSSNHVRAKSSDSIYKGNKSLVNQYLCFGASEQTVKATSSELRPYEIYERSVLSTA